MSATISTRRHYHLYLTNTKDNRPGSGPYSLLMPESPSFAGTLRQIEAEVREFRRISGGCHVSYKVVDPATGDRIDFEATMRDLWLAKNCK